MTGQEIIEKLNELQVTPEQLSELDFDHDEVTSALGPVKRVFHKGGEGQGEDYFNVILFENHGVHIRVDAFYTSYEGADYSYAKFQLVTPQVREVTFYE
jgi:hypothetical protein